MIVADLFSGAGGSAMGLYRWLIKQFPDLLIVGIDINLQPHYPAFHKADYAKHFRFVQGDALQPPFDLAQFDFVWASPPCQRFTGLQDVNRARHGITKHHPDLIDKTRQVLIVTGKPYIIENVQKAPLKTQVILCGTSLGLPNIQRHRHFESNYILFQPKCTHRFSTGKIIGVYGKLNGRKISFKKEYPDTYAARNIEHARALLKIDWMDDGEIQEAIPPAYSEYLIRQIFPAR